MKRILIISSLRSSYKIFNRFSSQAVPLSYNLYSTMKLSNPEKPPIIIMHGLLGNKNNWRTYCQNFSSIMPNRKFIAVDARNHGESPHSPDHTYSHLAEDIMLLLKNLNIPIATMIGHSMGGKAMMAVALKYPKIVESAIILDISHKTDINNLFVTEGIFQGMQMVQIPKDYNDTEARQKAREILLEYIGNDYTVAFVLRNFKRLPNGEYGFLLNVDGLKNSYNDITGFPPELLELKYSGPVLFIGGTRAGFIEEEHWPDIQQIFPNAKLSWVEGGHLLHLEKPTETTELISTFLNSI